MNLEASGLPGCWIVRGQLFSDVRGTFHKLFHREEFEAAGLRTDWAEEYVSVSSRGVIRGMHFQAPPSEHTKLVYCLGGEVIDVVVDLRHGSPSFGQHRSLAMTPQAAIGIYVPPGFAHGFQALRDDSIMLYKVTSVHDPLNDCGISWDSFGYEWPLQEAVISNRDRCHPSLAELGPVFQFSAFP